MNLNINKGILTEQNIKQRENLMMIKEKLTFYLANVIRKSNEYVPPVNQAANGSGGSGENPKLSYDDSLGMNSIIN